VILTFIDTETTGLDLFNHEIIDIAAVQYEFSNNDLTLLLSREHKVKPKHIEKASEVALKINGYTKRKWKKAINIEEFLPELKQIIEKSDFLVGQNLIFDYRFINKAFDQANMERPKYPMYFDTKWMADQLVHDKKLKRSSLDFLCEHYQIKFEGRAHTALADVLRTADLFKVLQKECEVLALSFDSPFDPYGAKNGK
jgi:DNA polymerase III epsilon subunit-like protein